MQSENKTILLGNMYSSFVGAFSTAVQSATTQKTYKRGCKTIPADIVALIKEKKINKKRSLNK